MLQAENENLKISSQNQFDKYLQEHDFVREEYRTLFYSHRKQLQEEDFEKWQTLNPLYPEMEIFLGRLNPATTYIVTTKDLKSVELILEAHSIKLNPENMYRATRTYGKPMILQEIIQKNKIDPADLHFIDDHVATLIEVSEHIHVNCYCADWGYNTLEQQAKLVKRDIQIDSIDNFSNRFI